MDISHVNIEGNECADSLTKTPRDHGHPCTTTTLTNANPVVRLLTHSFKKPLIKDFDSLRIIAFIIARLRSHHYKGMEIYPDEARSCIQSKNCPEIQRPNTSSDAQLSLQEH
ncbi:hypothetical protein TNCV_4624131 [Trichonephila clavipes]|nr:hypothetical protein TNCV_4624131 [Trichonephila clavipes]